MRLLRVGEQGSEVPVLQGDDGRHHDLSPVLGGGDLDGAFFARGGIEAARTAFERGELRERSVEGLRIGAPIARPSAVLCIGQNYAAHVAESNSPPPEVPVLFFKHPNTVVGPFDEVRIPRGSSETDWELELGVVIGKTCRYLGSPAEAASHIAGFTIANDVSERKFQRDLSGGQASKGKCCETFNPVGPFLVPASEVEDPQSLGMRSWVNGEPRQNSTTADMIFTVDFLVWHLSQFLVLEPGDLLNTGTPEGVAVSGRFPYLKLGDAMSFEIDGLGRQEQRLVAAG